MVRFCSILFFLLLVCRRALNYLCLSLSFSFSVLFVQGVEIRRRRRICRLTCFSVASLCLLRSVFCLGFLCVCVCVMRAFCADLFAHVFFIALLYSLNKKTKMFLSKLSKLRSPSPSFGFRWCTEALCTVMAIFFFINF